MSDFKLLSLEQIQAWLNQPLQAWLANFELGSVSLLEHLTNDVVAPDAAFEACYDCTGRFLARLEQALSQDQAAVQGKLAVMFGVLMAYLVECGPYRLEVKRTANAETVKVLLDKYCALRHTTTKVALQLFSLPVFDAIRQPIEMEINPLLNSALEQFDGMEQRYMPFRVLLAGAIAEQLRFIKIRVDEEKIPNPKPQNPKLGELLQAMYEFKYLRFGTSGYRGVWGRDFTERIVRLVSQSICDFLAAKHTPKYAAGIGEDLSGRVVVIGYDGRRNSPLVARIVAETCLANGFTVYFASAPTPTPALNFFAREVIGRDRVAGLVNCTASHNPPEWQGIKFNPKEGYPAPTNLTDIIASRATARQLLGTPIPKFDVAAAEAQGTFCQFDPKEMYWDWVKESGQGNRRLSINLDAIRTYFSDKKIVLDPMYGSGRGYLSKLLGELGVPHVAIHDERDEDLGWQTERVRGVPHLQYANPEPDFIQPLIDRVVKEDAALGLGLDTDADRFGVVDRNGVYIRPNQILAMLTRYLGVERGETGRVIITQTGLPMMDTIAQKIPESAPPWRPPAGTTPAYVAHAFYIPRVGEESAVSFPNTYVVPVGIKYIIDVARIPEAAAKAEEAYTIQPDRSLPANWMDRILIGGEESSGLTTRGHVPDKDGIWANLLVLDMLAYYGLKRGKPQLALVDVWEETTKMEGCWPTYGDRLDLDTTAYAKESLLNHFLDLGKGWQKGDPRPELAGLDVYYLGGIRYDFVEVFLEDKEYGRKHYLRVRASGTEPITRVYVESASRAIADNLLAEVLKHLDALNTSVLEKAYDLENLADLLSNTHFSSATLLAAQKVIASRKWSVSELRAFLTERRPHIESRNVKLVEQWVKSLSVTA